MTKLYKDERGHVGSLFKTSSFTLTFVEDRISKSKRGVIRGFHGDNKTWKMCYCLYGQFKLVVFDLKWKTTHRLVFDENSEGLLIGPHQLNAHQCLSKECILYYKWTEYYDLDSQSSVYYNDETINPKWEDFEHIISSRDRNAPRLK